MAETAAFGSQSPIAASIFCDMTMADSPSASEERGLPAQAVPAVATTPTTQGEACDEEEEDRAAEDRIPPSSPATTGISAETTSSGSTDSAVASGDAGAPATTIARTRGTDADEASPSFSLAPGAYAVARGGAGAVRLSKERRLAQELNDRRHRDHFSPGNTSRSAMNESPRSVPPSPPLPIPTVETRHPSHSAPALAAEPSGASTAYYQPEAVLAPPPPALAIANAASASAASRAVVPYCVLAEPVGETRRSVPRKAGPRFLICATLVFILLVGLALGVAVGVGVGNREASTTRGRDPSSASPSPPASSRAPTPSPATASPAAPSPSASLVSDPMRGSDSAQAKNLRKRNGAQ